MSESELLTRIAAGYERILGGTFVGMYVHGSLAFGCYDRRVSDIDFLVVVSQPPSEDARIRMIQLLLSLEPYAPAKGFEMSVVLERFCREFVYPTPYELHYSNSHRERAMADIAAYCREMRGTDKDLAAHFTVTQAVGYAVCGPAVGELFCEVPRDAYIDSLHYDIDGAALDIVENPVYVTLNLCRVLAYLRGDGVLSKRGGGEWGLHELPRRWHPLIRAALDGYAGKAAAHDMAAGRAFAQFMLDEIGKYEKRRVTMLSDMTPFRLAGNLYFVGTYKASSHLIDTGDGLILIDTGYAETADVIVDSMKLLGFDIADVKYILHSHGHGDHTYGTAKLLTMCKAETWLHEADARFVAGRFVPDHSYRDGDVIRLGNTEILCLETPGHTMGTVSFFFDLVENGKTYRAGMFGGAGTNQLKKSYLKSRGLSYLKRGYYFRSIERLKSMQVDIFVGNHTWNNDTKGNYEKSLTAVENPFIDSTRWGKFLDSCEKTLEQILRDEGHSEFINFAHRGASEYAPENTLLSFNLGIFMGANGIETDVQLTKDGIPVLFHDDTLARVTGEEGCVSDYTYEELRRFWVSKNEHRDKILKLEDFLTHIAFRDITLAIELKQRGTAKIVADMVRRYGLEKKVVITSFNFAELCDMRAYAPELDTGYLASKVDDELLENMRVLGIDEICPRANLITAESVAYWHRLGFNVRAWGVSSTELMRQVYDAHADGMTVNFPDKLAEYIGSGK